MRPHDEIYHYGVKGMKWDVKKKSTVVSETEKTEQWIDENGDVHTTTTGGGVPLSVTEKLDMNKYDIKNGRLVQKSKFEIRVNELGKKVIKDFEAGKRKFDALFKKPLVRSTLK